MRTALAVRIDRMKKVLFLTPSLGMGGMERVLVNYANLFCRRGYDVTVLNFTYDDPAIVGQLDRAVHYEKNYIPVPHILHAPVKDILTFRARILPWGRWIKFHSAKYLYKKYVKDRYDIEIAFFGSETIKIISGSDNKKAKKIGWVHNVNVEDDIPPLGSFKKAKKVYDDIETLICVSQPSKKKIEEIFGRTERVYAVNNPNDTAAIRRRADEGGAPEKKRFTFVNVSRIDEHQKGFLRLLSACKRLKDENFGFDVWIVGDGVDADMIKAKAKEYGLDNVVFFGRQENPYKFIKAADVYLCSSYFEGFSMVMMEAVILAKPMLTTDVSGARDMLGDSEYGIIVENSEEGLYDGMRRVLSDEKVFDYYKKKADERKDYLSEKKIMDKVEEIING